VSVGFTGTYWLTALILLAATVLLCYDRWKGLLPGFGAGTAYDPRRHRAGGTGASSATALTWIRLMERQFAELTVPLAVLAAGVALGAAIVVRYRRRVRPSA
jgi:hypothetical protein